MSQTIRCDTAACTGTFKLSERDTGDVLNRRASITRFCKTCSRWKVIKAAERRIVVTPSTASRPDD